jgi:hypothetical protein
VAKASKWISYALIKPDVPISGIRLSEWFHRRLTNEAPTALSATGRHPVLRTPWRTRMRRYGEVCTNGVGIYFLRVASSLDPPQKTKQQLCSYIYGVILVMHGLV